MVDQRALQARHLQLEAKVDGMEVARRMIQATEAAAQAAATSTASAIEMMRKQTEDRAGHDTDWFKLLPKPGTEVTGAGSFNVERRALWTTATRPR